MRRRTLLTALWITLGLVWLPFTAEAQQPKLHRLASSARSSSGRLDILCMVPGSTPKRFAILRTPQYVQHHLVEPDELVEVFRLVLRPDLFHRQDAFAHQLKARLKSLAILAISSAFQPPPTLKMNPD
jgi:hypothetical protein